MAAGVRLVTAGVVGRPHGLDGSFHVELADHPLGVGAEVELGGVRRRVERRSGTDRKPVVRLAGIDDRDAAAAARGELLLVEDSLADGEWLAEDLVGCRVDGLGAVVRVIAAPSCDVLELDGGALVPLVSDAVRRVDPDAGTIEVDRRFLAIEGGEDA